MVDVISLFNMAWGNKPQTLLKVCSFSIKTWNLEATLALNSGLLNLFNIDTFSSKYFPKISSVNFKKETSVLHLFSLINISNLVKLSYLESKSNWMYVLIMSYICFRKNPHSITSAFKEMISSFHFFFVKIISS